MSDKSERRFWLDLETGHVCSNDTAPLNELVSLLPRIKRWIEDVDEARDVYAESAPASEPAPAAEPAKPLQLAAAQSELAEARRHVSEADTWWHCCREELYECKQQLAAAQADLEALRDAVAKLPNPSRDVGSIYALSADLMKCHAAAKPGSGIPLTNPPATS